MIRSSPLSLRDALDFLMLRSMQRQDTAALTDILRFILKVNEMKDLTEYPEIYVFGLFTRFVWRFKSGCDDENAVKRVEETLATIRQLWAEIRQELKPLWEERERTKDTERIRQITALLT